MRTRCVTPGVRKKVAGSAAIEVVLLVAVFILPVYVLLFNMGYNGIRMRETRDALRLGAYLFVDGLATGSREPAQESAEKTVNSEIFAEEENPATLTTSVTGHLPETDPENDFGNLGVLRDLFSNLSFWQTVEVSVTREPPFGGFGDTPLRGSIIVGASTFTYCEMHNDDLISGYLGQGLGGISRVISFLGKSALWLFGGVADGDDKCT